MVSLGKYPIKKVRKYLSLKRFERYLDLKKERWYTTKIYEGIDIYLDILSAIQKGQKTENGIPLEILKDYIMSHITRLSAQGSIIVYPLLLRKLNERKITYTFSSN